MANLSETTLVIDRNDDLDNSSYSSGQETECTEAVLSYEPTFSELFTTLGWPGWTLLALASLSMLLLVLFFVETLLHVMRYTHTRHKVYTANVLTVYPILGLCNYLGILFPKSNLILDAAGQLWFAMCMWQFLCLTLSYFGGERRFVEVQGGTRLPWKGPPCCCWPCCRPCLPKTPVNKFQVKVLKGLVLQHPFVQTVMTIIGITLWIEGLYRYGEYAAANAFPYIFWITFTSFLFALWAFIVGFKASLPVLREFHYKGKIVSFQLCLVFLRFQGLIMNLILLPTGAIPCVPPLSPVVFGNILLCSLVLGQLVILSVLARHYYKLPCPELVYTPESPVSKIPLINRRQDPESPPEENGCKIGRGCQRNLDFQDPKLINYTRKIAPSLKQDGAV